MASFAVWKYFTQVILLCHRFSCNRLLLSPEQCRIGVMQYMSIYSNAVYEVIKKILKENCFWMSSKLYLFFNYLYFPLKYTRLICTNCIIVWLMQTPVDGILLNIVLSPRITSMGQLSEKWWSTFFIVNMSPINKVYLGNGCTGPQEDAQVILRHNLSLNVIQEQSNYYCV